MGSESHIWSFRCFTTMGGDVIQGVMIDSQIKKSSKLYAQAILPMGCPIMDNNSDFLGVTILNLSIFVFGP